MNEQSLKDRLRTISKERNIRFNECWKKLILERFLFRLSCSSYAQKFIFKGGFLLAYLMEIGRETMDLDFLLTKMKAKKKEIKEAINEIISLKLQDGFAFTYGNIEFLEQPHMDYTGYRVSLQATFGRMKDKIYIDVGVGDIVQPTNRKFSLFTYKGSPMFEDEISLMVYPPETIFAEKLETVLSKGSLNSRMKDYHDLLLLTRKPHMINFITLRESINSTFHNRGIIFQFISFDEKEIKSLQKFWIAHRKNLGTIAEELHVPISIQEVIVEINKSITNLLLLSLKLASIF